jgi:orotate phosphoribosyltransferase
MSTTREQVLELLIKHSVKIAPPGGPLFQFASGGEGRFYIDVKKTAMRGDAYSALAAALQNIAREFEPLSPAFPVNTYAGVVLGGCHLASLCACWGLQARDVIYVRKEAKGHGTKNLVESADLAAGTKVVLFEDVVTTGGSSLKAVAALAEAGFTVLAIIAVVDRREQPSTKLGEYEFRSIFTMKDFDGPSKADQ